MTLAVSAPGKAVLCGEYVVLEGAPAIVMAADRRAIATGVGNGNGNESPFTKFALQKSRAFLRSAGISDAQLEHIAARVQVDSTALYDGATKFGLGSSAAVTTAVVGLCFEAAGVGLGNAQNLFDVAQAAHAAAQGTRGSGIDIAASVWGGVTSFRRQHGAVQVASLTTPNDLALTFVYLGRSASTSAQLDRIAALQTKNPAAHAALYATLHEIAEAFTDAWRAGDTSAVIIAAGQYGEAMDALGCAADIEIVTSEMRTLHDIAKTFSASAKPSGAGGGDLAVVFSSIKNQLALQKAIAKSFIGTGVQLLQLHPSTKGVQVQS